MSKKKTKEEFIIDARKVHGDKYDYSKVEYVDARTKVCIICPEHGEFWQSPDKHIHGRGCPSCAEISRRENSYHIDTKKFIEDAIKIHGDKYDYSETKCDNNHSKVKIICPIHGVFEQDYIHHINRKHGCPKCGNESSHSSRIKTFEFFKEKANEVHGGKYEYVGDYTKTKGKTTIICPIHGEFVQEVQSHLQGHGCPKCANQISNAETEIYNFICELIGEKNVTQRNRDALDKKELDIFIPSKNIAIEYNGLVWHSEKFNKNKNYHLEKLNECNEKGIKLIQIFEDEYLNHKDIVLSKIKHVLDLNDNDKIYGRKCSVSEIDKSTAEAFLNNNHIQGFTNSTVYIGAFYSEKLIAVMTFLNEKDNSWNLTRFASSIQTKTVGVAGKIFNWFVKQYKPSEIKSFADRRWTLDADCNLYTNIGFKIDSVLKPDYKYVNGTERKHKFGFRKEILHRKFNVPLEWTENVMTNYLGFYRIWDCGLFKYVWKT